MDPKLPRVATQPESGWDERDDLDQLYRRHAPWLAAMLRDRFGHGVEAEADDVVQETYARLAPLDPATIRSPRAWLTRVAFNLTKDLLRRRAVRQRDAKLVEVHSRQGPIALSPLEELILTETILSIPEAYRDVFVLSRFHGLTYEEIATRCGLTAKAVEWRLGKAIDHCVKRVQD